MRYRTRTGKTYGDQAIAGNVAKGVDYIAKTKAPFISRFLSGIFGQFVATSAFISRSFLRLNLGERSFGLITILMVYLIIWLIYLYPQAYTGTCELFFDEGGIMEGVDQGSLGMKLLVFFAAILYVPAMMLRKDMSIHLSPDMPYMLDWFVFIILLISVAHLIEVYARRLNKTVIHSLYRGDSVFFSWMIGLKIGGTTITPLGVWMIVEPLFLLAVAYLMNSVLGWMELSLVLFVSAICLFLEEYRVYVETRRIILDVLDGRLDAVFMSRIQSTYGEKLKEAEGNQKNLNTSASRVKTSQTGKETAGSNSPYRVKVV